MQGGRKPEVESPYYCYRRGIKGVEQLLCMDLEAVTSRWATVCLNAVVTERIH